MKHLPLLFIMAALQACNDTPRQAEIEDDQAQTVTDSPTMRIQIPESGCYIHVSGRDTIGLKIEVFPNVVTGTLHYDFHEKDKSRGDIEGTLKGDTLIADYTFMAEGVRSVRQVAFLVSDTLVIEGYAESEEKGAKMTFKDAAKIDFTKGTRFRKVSCLDYDPANNNEAVSANATGSEVLFQHQWNLAELEGHELTSTSRTVPHLLFYPGQVSRVSGSTGCNRMNGAFELSGTSNMKFSALATTKMACPDSDIESRFFKVLEKVDGWRIVGNELLLNNGNTLVAKLKGVNAESTTP